VFRTARDRFARPGTGIRLTNQSLDSAEFASSIGFIRVEASRSRQGETDIIITTREHDAEAVAFITSLSRPGIVFRLRRRIGSSRNAK
jgi:hypothetical protein